MGSRLYFVVAEIAVNFPYFISSHNAVVQDPEPGEFELLFPVSEVDSDLGLTGGEGTILAPPVEPVELPLRREIDQVQAELGVRRRILFEEHLELSASGEGACPDLDHAGVVGFDRSVSGGAELGVPGIPGRPAYRDTVGGNRRGPDVADLLQLGNSAVAEGQIFSGTIRNPAGGSGGEQGPSSQEERLNQLSEHFFTIYNKL